MIDFNDPNAVHEFVLQILMVIFAASFLTAILYINSWFRFVAELRDKEPDVWQSIGAPTLQKIFFQKQKDARMFWAFFPVLKARLNNPRYRHAGATWALFKLGIILCVVMFGMVGFLIYWMQAYGL